MGRGAIYLIFSQGIFMLTSFVVLFWLGRHWGPELYGTFGVAIAIMTVVGFLLTNGLPLAASKYIAESSDQIGAVVRKSLQVQIVSTLLIAGLLVGLAGPLAHLLGNRDLIQPIRWVALIILVHPFYSLYEGFLNGARSFSKQAAALTSYSLIKMTAIFVLVLLGLGVKGAILGYAVASFFALLVARYFFRAGPGQGDFPAGKLIQFSLLLIAFHAAINLITNLDLLFVNALLDDRRQTGLYTAAMTLGRAPYYLFVGLAFALLPSISRSAAASDTGQSADYIVGSLRYMLLMLIPATLVVSATSRSLLVLLYSGEYPEGASALSILVFGWAMLSVFYILATVVFASGRPGTALAVAMPLVGVSTLLNRLLIPALGLEGAALATTITALIGLLMIAVYVQRRFGALLGLGSAVRIAVASLAVYGLALALPDSALWLPLEYVGLAGVYLVLLALLREFRREDKEFLARTMAIWQPARTRPPR